MDQRYKALLAAFKLLQQELPTATIIIVASVPVEGQSYFADNRFAHNLSGGDADLPNVLRQLARERDGVGSA